MCLATFPQELIDGIIESQGDDVPTLSACSLVSRSWLYPSQRCLFRELYLKIEPKRHRHLSRVLELLEGAPHIAAHFRRLLVLDETRQGRKSDAECLHAIGLFADVLRRLVNLRQVEVALCGDRWGPVPVVEDVFRDVFSLSTLRTLAVSSVPKASRLSLAFVSVCSDPNELGEDHCAAPLEAVDSLSLLLDDHTLENFQSFLLPSSIPEIFPNLTTLEISVLSWNQAMALQQVLNTKDFPLIESFRCNLNCYIYKSDDMAGCPLNLSHFRRVYLSVQTQRLDDWVHEDHPASRVVEWWRDSLSTLAASGIEAITFELPLSQVMTGENERAHWIEIDRLLAGFPWLQSVHLRNSDAFPFYEYSSVKERARDVLVGLAVNQLLEW
ncbi:hypothetical protein BDZ89DRAFT_1078599 [Hymenopellis radicata]|nr:hypothetical protein BDZ89DRAFT_1078599 [Hymenopellis radicata]